MISLLILISALAAISFNRGREGPDFRSENIFDSLPMGNADNLNEASIDVERNNVTETPGDTPGSASSNIIGTRDYGRVLKSGPYGNINSDVKVAYIVGVHPWEHNAHQAAIESIQSRDNSLNKCYYIYQVVVTRNAEDYSQGRMNGQLLANAFAVPDIINNDFQLAVDIHSHQGNYPEDRFMFSPIPGGRSESIARRIAGEIPGMIYFVPHPQSSPEYVTIPLINAGIPSVIFETLIDEPYSTTQNYVNNLVTVVDKL